MAKLVALLLCFLTIPVFGSPTDPSLNQTFDSIYVAVMDNPTRLKQWAAEQLNRSEKKGPDHAYAFLVATYAMACSEMRCAADDPINKAEVLARAISIAEKGRDTTLLIRLEILKLRLSLDQIDNKAAEAGYERIRALAEARGSFRMQAEVYREMSALVERDADLPQALRRIQQAIQLSKQEPLDDDLVPIIIQHDAALHFRRAGDTARAMELYNYALKYLRDKKIHHFATTAMVNIARSKMGSGDPKDMAEAAALLEEARDMLKGMDEPEALAYIELSRGDIAFKRNQFQLALTFFDRALQNYTALGATIWIGDVMHWQAKALNGLGKYEEALQMIEASKAKFPPGFKSDHYRLTMLQARIFEKMGRAQEGMKALFDLIRLKDEMEKESREQDVNKLKVQLQVQAKEQQNEILLRENAIQEKELRQAGIIRITAAVLLALCLVIFVQLLLSRKLARRLTRARAKTQKILDHIDEGIISIGRNSIVETSLSSYIYQMIQVDPKESVDLLRYIIDRADIASDQKQLVWSTLQSCLGENNLTWEMNVANLPHEIFLDGGNKILSLRWRSICNERQDVEQIILVIRDETLQRQLEQNLAEEKAEKAKSLEKILEIVGHPQGRVSGYFEALASRIRNFGEPIDSIENLGSIARELHTIKGEARTLGLKSLASRTHELEAHIDMKTGQRTDHGAFSQAYQVWIREVKSYDDLCQSLRISDGPSHQVRVVDFAQIIGEVMDGLKQHVKNQDLKLAEVHIIDDVGTIPEGVIQDIRTVLLHAATNSIDHGFILPRKKGLSFPNRVSMEFALTAVEDEFHLSIGDNGAGLDKKALAEAAERAGVDGSAGWDELIFLPGLSTASEATETSGRGVGMSAIRATAEKLGGRVTLQERSGGGTLLTLKWKPLKARLSA